MNTLLILPLVGQTCPKQALQENRLYLSTPVIVFLLQKTMALVGKLQALPRIQSNSRRITLRRIFPEIVDQLMRIKPAALLTRGVGPPDQLKKRAAKIIKPGRLLFT